MQLSVEYLRRVNLGNYEHSELKVSTVIKENDNIDIEIERLKLLVHSHLGIVEDEKQLILPIETAKKPVEAVVKTHNQPKEEIAVQNKVEEEVKEEPKKEKKETKAKKPVSETQPVKKISKTTAYDRTLDVHKNLLGAFLDKKYPKWRTSDLLGKATKASMALVGQDFLDENGDILESFKASFSSYLLDN